MIENSSSSYIISKLKVIFLGDPTVGKTSIISSIRQLEFLQKQQPTVGIDFFSKIVFKNNQSHKLQFWDTAGQERFRSIIPSYVRNANVGIIVFDTQNRSTFNNIHIWIQCFRENSPIDSQIIVLGNKIDLDKKQIQNNQIKEKLKQYNLQYLEVSAKNHTNIDKLMEKLVNCIKDYSQDACTKEFRAKSYAKLDDIGVEQQSIHKKNNHKCCGI